MFSKIFEGKVYHKRFKPKIHELNYKVCSFLFDLDELDQLDKSFKLFAYNRLNIVSFWNKDHGTGEDKPLRPYVENILNEAEIDIEGGPIRLLCYPRFFGYVFNPLSVYYCYSKDENLQAIIYEVSNTFGERHSYVIPAESSSDGVIKQKCQKSFYVSPFMEMNAEYAFRMVPPQDKISVSITQSDEDGTLLKANFNGTETPLSDASLLRILARYPLMTVKIILGIHWEALKLWKKGLKLVTRPPVPSHPVTLVSSSNQMEPKS
ncbi:conserved hypothetical protein [Candidatus Terasakiella magnetica]|uniref:DUF1365 domain-containing protein n=1 Tax=Candidatus Terasakiella magnetica TaxID=1867952 RepID=A0A1C3RGY4_9PROT|nr:DUF1365 domain-containing protein [Candidatus Terasakiella magnetica]SCA56553.1 conserved hypothetical protein [Candidatus Terasakiella magnetica]